MESPKRNITNDEKFEKLHASSSSTLPCLRWGTRIFTSLVGKVSGGHGMLDAHPNPGSRQC